MIHSVRSEEGGVGRDININSGMANLIYFCNTKRRAADRNLDIA